MNQSAIIHRAPSFKKPRRDPFGNDLQIVLAQMKREAVGLPSKSQLSTIDSQQVLMALICDAYREACFICDRKPQGVRVYFVPEELAKAGQKVIFYSLCHECRLDIATAAKVEAILASQLRDENARMGVI